MSKPIENPQAFLSAIIDSTDEAVIGKSLEGKILSWNKGAEKTYGYQERDVLGLNISIIIPPDREHEKDMFLDKIGQGQTIDHFETVRIRKDKVLIDVSLTISPIKNNTGEIIGASTIARDITKQKGLEARLRFEQSKAQAILDNVVDGIITIDEKGLVQSFNPASERIFGYSKEEVVGKNVKFLMPEPYHSEHDHCLQNYLSSGVAKIINIGREVEGLRKDKTVFPLELAISEVYVGEDRLFTGIVRDISERKSFENALKEAKEKADFANLSKSRFLANMSHEIRTPMNAVLGYSQILLRNPGLSKDVRDIIRTMSRSGQNLLALINEILDISKIEAGKMELKLVNFDLQSLVNELDSLFALRCNEKLLNWHVTNLPNSTIVYGDETKLMQVLINLIGNAVKFTDSGTVDLSITPLDQNNYQFDVKDTGAGIPAESQKDIFEPFQQEESGHKKGGTGLGLAISQKQLELMSSELQLESELNHGSRFFFKLMLPPAEGAIENENILPGTVLHLAPGLQVKALVVDDVMENRDVLRKLLTLIGLEVDEAVNGEEAIQKTRKFSPDIIFMDMRMPVMGGEEAAREIQEEFGKERFKLVAITASTLDMRRDYYINKGFHDFIGKPFKEERIFASLKNLLNVDFVYETQENPEEKVETQEELDVSGISLPEELLNRMKELADLCKVTDLENCIAEIDSLDMETNGLKSHLSSLLKKYDMEGISNLLNKVSAHKGGNQA